jgi:hypothetical protein
LTKIDRGRSALWGSEFPNFKVPNKGKCAVVFLYVNARYAKTANISGKKTSEFSPELYGRFMNDRYKTAKSNGLFEGVL